MKPSLQKIEGKNDTISTVTQSALAMNYAEFISEIGQLYPSNTQMFDELVSSCWALEERTLQYRTYLSTIGSSPITHCSTTPQPLQLWPSWFLPPSWWLSLTLTIVWEIKEREKITWENCKLPEEERKQDSGNEKGGNWKTELRYSKKNLIDKEILGKSDFKCKDFPFLRLNSQTIA